MCFFTLADVMMGLWSDGPEAIVETERAGEDWREGPSGEDERRSRCRFEERMEDSRSFEGALRGGAGGGS